MTLDEADLLSSARYRLKAALMPMGYRGCDEDTINGCLWILGDVLDIMERLLEKSPSELASTQVIALTPAGETYAR